MLIKRITKGEMIPPFYGVAWQEWHAHRAVCLPIPFNLLAAFLRGCWIFAKHGYRPVPMDPRDAYYQGRQDAWSE